MALLRPCFSIRTFLAAMAGALALTCAPGMATFAQHGGGGHVGGGGHFGGAMHAGSPHVASPHVSAPTAVHTAPSRPPTILYLPPAGGAGGRTFVATPPPVRFIPPPRPVRPVIGNRVMPPVIGPVGPHTTIGFPATGAMGGTTPLRFSPVTSLRGQGQVIWQDSANPVRMGRGTIAGVLENERRFPRRPRFPKPVFPIFAPPAFGFFGSPFFGLGLGFGFNSLWWPSCGPFWGWGYGCNALPYYDYGLGYGYSYGYSPNSLEGQIESEAGLQTYENLSSGAPTYVYGGEGRELAQLYLKDGTIYYATDYWLVNDQLHFRTVEEGGTKSVEHVIDFDQLDLQKTIDVNTANGFRFVLRNEPIDEYLRDHPNLGGSNKPPETGPSGPLPPPEPSPPGQPATPPQP